LGQYPVTEGFISKSAFLLIPHLFEIRICLSRGINRLFPALRAVSRETTQPTGRVIQHTLCSANRTEWREHLSELSERGTLLIVLLLIWLLHDTVLPADRVITGNESKGMWKENKSREKVKGRWRVMLKEIKELLLIYFMAATVVRLILSVLGLGVLTKRDLG
jgi:hypothetical protein